MERTDKLLRVVSYLSVLVFLALMFHSCGANAGEYVYLPGPTDDNEMFGLSNVYPSEDYQVKQTSLVTKGTAPAYHPIIPWTWSGVYIGGLVGGIWESNTIVNSATDALSQSALTSGIFSNGQDFKASGVFGGALIGANYQLADWVFSVEGDFNGVGINSSQTTNAIGSACSLSGAVGGSIFATLSTTQCGGSTTSTIREQMREYAQIRGRLGYNFNGLMPYFAAGLSLADIKVTIGGSCTGQLPGFTCSSPVGSNETWYTGYNIGGGIEYAIGNVLFRVEGFYYNLGSEHISAVPFDVNTGTISGWSTRGGISYLFH